MTHRLKTWARGQPWRVASRASLVLVGLLLLVTVVSATGGYDLSWWTVGGGGASSGGTYTLSGTAGQPEGGTMSGGDYAVSGGFWANAGESIPEQFKVLLPLISNGS